MATPDKLSAILKAREIVKALFIEDVSDIDIIAIAMERGAIVKEGTLKGSEGRLSVLGKSGIITVKVDIPEQGKKRFIAAHELGHFELHRLRFPTISCSDIDFHKWNKDKIYEVEANYFAAELLMPETMFKRRIERETLNRKLLDALSEEFQTSLTATAIRFVNFRPEYALICSENSFIKWFVINEEFPYFVNTMGKVHRDSLAYDFFIGERLPESFFPVDKDAWIENSRFRGKLMEMAIPLADYNQVLSLIYVEEGYD